MIFCSSIEEKHERHEQIASSLDDSPEPPAVSPPLTAMTCSPCAHRSELAIEGAALDTIECARCGLVGTTRVALPVLESRDVRRSRRHHAVRAKTISVKRITKRELEIGRMLYPGDVDDPDRPTERSECLNGDNHERPCPFVSCRHHLALDVSARTGAIKVNFPDLEAWEIPETCQLDVASRGGITLEETGRLMNLTRERVRQIEVKALTKIRKNASPVLLAQLRDAFGIDDVPGRGRARIESDEDDDYDDDAIDELGADERVAQIIDDEDDL